MVPLLRESAYSISLQGNQLNFLINIFLNILKDILFGKVNVLILETFVQLMARFYHSGLGSKKHPLHLLIPHGAFQIRNLPSLKHSDLLSWFEGCREGKIEGIVWHCNDGCLIKVMAENSWFCPLIFLRIEVPLKCFLLIAVILMVHSNLMFISHATILI